MVVKITVFTPFFSLDGAASLRIRSFVDCLKNRSFNVKVVEYNPQLHDKKEMHKKYIRYCRVLPKLLYKIQIPNPLVAVDWFVIAIKELNIDRPDIVLVTTPPFGCPIGVFFAILVSNLKAKIIVDYRDDWTSILNKINVAPLKLINFILSKILHYVCAKSEVVLAVNETLKKIIFSRTGKDNIVVIKNGADLNKIEKFNMVNKYEILGKYNIANNKNNALWGIYAPASLDTVYYNPEFVVTLIKKAVDCGIDIKVIILGDGKRRNKIDELRKTLNLEDRIILLGRVKHEDVLKLISVCDFAIYELSKLGQEHGIGQKIYEYICVGLPIFVVADANSKILKLVKDLKIGRGVTWDTKNIEHEFVKFLEDLKKISKKLKYREKYLKEKFGRDKQVLKFLQIVNALVQE